MADAMKEARLPKWAQAELADLRRRLDYAEDERDDLREGLYGPEDTDTQADPYGSTPVNLKKGETVSFRLGYGTEDVIHCRVKDNLLEVMGLGLIELQPVAGNVVQIGVRRD